MKTKRVLTVLILALVTVFLSSACLLCLPSTYSVYAAESEETTETPTVEENSEVVETETEGIEEQPTDTENETPTEPDDTDIDTDNSTDDAETDNESISDSVKEYLQNIYGDDYETYYNKIVENWGSVEKYLLEASENLPEEYQYKATELATKINAYIGVAADGILLLCVGIYIVYRANKNKKVSSDLDRLKTASNQTQSAQLAIMSSLTATSEALKALMPNQKFETATSAITESETELAAAKEELNKNV